VWGGVVGGEGGCCVEGGREGGLKGRMGWWKQIIDGGGVNLSQARVFSRAELPPPIDSTYPLCSAQPFLESLTNKVMSTVLSINRGRYVVLESVFLLSIYLHAVLWRH
jgi:hypothetical protein